ncbi:hypothetical protein [Kitasatospora sp. NPDC058478]|uniref:hypothetical protein n=1 Tax=unclassified Kitasatospora TaxID=2633591 RepID=UPI003648BD2A
MGKDGAADLSFRSKLTRVAVMAGLAAAAVISITPSAFAGTSGNTFGCWSTWGSTGSNAHCQNVQKSGYFQNYGYCDWEADQTSTNTWFDEKSTVNNWGQIDCTFNISRSLVNWTQG